MPRILVLGGSGFVGRHVCRLLVQAGLLPTVPTRQGPGPQWEQTHPGVRVIGADVLDPDQLPGLLQGHDVVINLVAILHGRPDEFERVHVTLPGQLARACGEAGVQHLVHVSALGADALGPSHYQRSKARGEAALTEIARATGLALTLVRPSVIFGRDDRFVNLLARLQRFAPLLPLAGAYTRFQPVWVGDVAGALCLLATSAPEPLRLLEACGPEVFTLAEIADHAGQWSGHKRPVLPLPVTLAQLQAWVMEHLPGPTLMSRDNIDSMQVDNVASGWVPGLAELGIVPRRMGEVFVVAERTIVG